MRAQGSALLTPEHTDMPQRCPEATQTCSGVSIFDSRAHSETTKGFNGESGALRDDAHNVNRNTRTVGWQPDLKIKGPNGFFNLKVKPGKKYVISF